jgi:hypothetical protein
MHCACQMARRRLCGFIGHWVCILLGSMPRIVGSTTTSNKQGNITIRSSKASLRSCIVSHLFCVVLLFRLESYLHRGRSTRPPSGLVSGTIGTEDVELTPKQSNNQPFRLIPIRNKTTPAFHLSAQTSPHIPFIHPTITSPTGCSESKPSRRSSRSGQTSSSEPHPP